MRFSILSKTLAAALVSISIATGSARAAEDPSQADAILRIVREQMASGHLRAVIVRVTIDGKEVVTEALGESMTGVPATKDMHFRNGAVAISYLATLLLQLVDEKKVSLDDAVGKWLPQIPHADRITLGQLARMQSGFHDYVLGNEAFGEAFYGNPFRQWTTDELLAFSLSKPLVYEPGTNWNYAHTNYVILGLALEKITGKSMPTLMQERIFEPLKLQDTFDPGTPEIKPPVLHTFTSERREMLGIPPKARFYEEATYWNPSWTIARGAIQYTNVYDLTTTAEAIGTGKLLSPDSHAAQLDPKLRGFGSPVEGCSTCRKLSGNVYGIGVWLAGSWLMQNPKFGGGCGLMAYLPSKKIAIGLGVTFREEAFDETGGYPNAANDLLAAIGTHLAPNDPPAARP